METPEETNGTRRLAVRRWTLLVLIAVLLSFAGMLGGSVVFETLAGYDLGMAHEPVAQSEVHAPG